MIRHLFSDYFNNQNDNLKLFVRDVIIILEYFLDIRFVIL